MKVLGTIDGYDVQEILRALELMTATIDARVRGPSSARKLLDRWSEMMDRAGIGRYEPFSDSIRLTVEPGDRPLMNQEFDADIKD